ncbi:MAG: hypothetical protein KIG91_09590 [Treponema sp.]|nr:hypothetical protein [Treponema sp.]
MAAVIISIFLIGGSVFGIYCFLEEFLLDLNRKMWEQWKELHSENKKRSA